MVNVKHLINSTNNMETHRDDNDELRNRFVGTIVDILSNKTWDNKQDMIELKKRIRAVLDFDPSQIENLTEFKDLKRTINNLVTNDIDAEWIITTLNIFSWMKDTWLWKDIPEEDFGCNIEMFSEQSKNQFIEISKRFSLYANSFSNYYKKLWIDYMHKYKKIPNYKYLLKKIFCNYMGRYIKQSLQKMQFSEEECKECFWAIQECLWERWFCLEASDNIKQDFIKLCREEYPLAPKKNDFLLETKSFKQAFINYMIEWLDKHLENMFDDMVQDCEENVENFENENSSKIDDDFRDLENVSEEYLHNLFLLVNVAIGTIASINRLMDEWSWKDNAIGFYFQNIADQFEYDHQKKQERALTSKKDPITPHKMNLSDSRIFTSEKTNWWEKTLSEEENNLIKEAASYIDCDKKRSIIKYITKLKMKDLPIRFYDFKRLFNLKEIPPLTESILIDKLWMDYEVEEEELVAEEEILKEKATKKAADKNEVCLQEKLIIDNPTDYLIDKLKVAWCKFDNEATARKQIDEFCLNDNYKTVLINLMRSPRFGKVFIHKPGHKTARLLRVWRTGWRILFSKRKDWKLHFICFGNHNYYEDRLAMLK